MTERFWARRGLYKYAGPNIAASGTGLRGGSLYQTSHLIRT